MDIAKIGSATDANNAVGNFWNFIALGNIQKELNYNV
jgi:hypothetical protein